LKAVTQAFNTTSSMGRLTLNVLLSFAQLERELASERLRDKAAASRARGLWQAGPRAFGYQVERGRLILAEREAEAVQDSEDQPATLGMEETAPQRPRAGISFACKRPPTRAAAVKQS